MGFAAEGAHPRRPSFYGRKIIDHRRQVLLEPSYRLTTETDHAEGRPGQALDISRRDEGGEDISVILQFTPHGGEPLPPMTMSRDEALELVKVIRVDMLELDPTDARLG
jgi:hypothetical protein